MKRVDSVKGPEILRAGVILLLVVLTVSFFVVAAEAGERSGLLVKEAEDLSDTGKIAKAVDMLREAAAADPGDPALHDRLGYLLLQAGHPDDAISAFTAALTLQPNFHTSRTGIGLALLKKGDLKAAEEELKAALALNPYPSMTHYALGLVYEKMGDYEKAVSEYKEGIRTFRAGKK